MTTKEERAQLWKNIGRTGRTELLELLRAAFDQLDAYEDRRAPFPSGEGQTAAVQTEPALPAQAERGPTPGNEPPCLSHDK
jgi:hypothetical protein